MILIDEEQIEAALAAMPAPEEQDANVVIDYRYEDKTECFFLSESEIAVLKLQLATGTNDLHPAFVTLGQTLMRRDDINSVTFIP